MRPIKSLSAVLFVVLLACAASAQPLADRIPADALVYVGWAGADKLTPAYAQSRLKGVVDSSNLVELFSTLLPKVAARLEKENDPESQLLAKEIVPLLADIAPLVWKNPSAVYFGPLDFSGKQPIPKIAVFCQAGADAQALGDKISGFITPKIPADSPLKIRIKVAAGVLVISTFDLPENFGESLAQREQFKTAIAQGRPDAAFTAFFEIEKALNVASLGINMAGDTKTKSMWQKILLTTGIGGVKRILYTAGFDEKDWGSQAYIEAPQPRMGLLATIVESEPLSDDLLKLAPQSSNWVSAARFDLAKTFLDTRTAMSRFDPQASHDFEAGLKQLGQAIGLDVQKELLAPLGGQWLVFNSAQTGHGLLGLTVINPLRDSAKAKSAFASLEKQANEAMAKGTRDQGITLSIETAKMDELEVHYLAVPLVAPSWAIKNDRLYASLFPQILAGAAEQAAAGKSILDNPVFVAARKRLNVKDAVSLSFMNLPELAPRGYQMALALQQTVMGFGDLAGLDLPTSILPPLNKLEAQLAPSMSSSWVDETGWHYRAVSPFPLADLLGGEQALVTTGGPALVAVALPAMAKARQQAMAVQSMSNLRQIGLGAITYANEKGGALPQDLGTMMPYIMNPAVFLMPQHEHAPLPANAKPEELATWVNQNSDYVYIGNELGKLTEIRSPATTIIAFEKGDGPVNALYADGHVERIFSAQSLAEQLARQRKLDK